LACIATVDEGRPLRLHLLLAAVTALAITASAVLAGGAAAVAAVALPVTIVQHLGCG